MKVYTIVDDSIVILKTVDRLKALERLYKLSKKYEKKQDWFWIDEEEVN